MGVQIGRSAFVSACVFIAVAIIANADSVGADQSFFRLDKLRLSLSIAEPIATVGISNDSEDLRVVEMEPVPFGRPCDAAERTPDLIVSPAIVRLAPHSTRTLRVGVRDRVVSAVEAAYYICFTSVPLQATTGRASINIVMQYLMPTFVLPGASGSTGAHPVWDASRAGDDHVIINVLNEGNEHLRITRVAVFDDINRHGQVALARGLSYVLAHARNSWRLALERPLRAAAVSIEATTDTGPIYATVPVR